MTSRERLILTILAVLAGLGAILGLVSYLNEGPENATVADDGTVIEVFPKQSTKHAAAERVPVETSAAERAGMVVRVLSPRGDVVAGAAVSVVGSDGNEWIHRELTRQGGSVRVSYPLANRVLVTVSCTGYAYSQQWLTQPFPQELEVRLALPATIGGTVRLANGIAPGFPVRVFAWPAGTAQPLVAFSDPPTIPWVEADASGRFEIGGLDPGTDYSLGAGVLGWTTQRIAERVTCGAHDAKLILWRVFACMVKVRERNGGLPPNSQFVYTAKTVSPVPGSESIHPLGVDMALAGLGRPGAMQEHSDWRNLLYAYKAANPKIALGPVDVFYRVAGYAETTASIPFFPVADTIPIRTVFLSPTTNGFGRAKIRLLTDGDSPPRVALFGPPTAVVEFQPLYGDAKKMVVSYLGLSDVERMVEGLPYGEYRVHFIAAGGEYRDPAQGEPVQTVSIGEKLTEITFDARPLCSALLLFPSLDSRSSPSQLSVEAQRIDNYRSVAYAFDAPPYLLQGLSPGKYRLNLAEGLRPEGVAGSIEVELHGSHVERIDWPAKRGK